MAAAAAAEEEEGERREVFLSVPAVCSGSGSAAAGAARRELRIARPAPTPPARAPLSRPPWPGTTTTSSSCSSSATAVRAEAAEAAWALPGAARGGLGAGWLAGRCRPARGWRAGLPGGRLPHGSAEGLRAAPGSGWGCGLRSRGAGRRLHYSRPLPHV